MERGIGWYEKGGSCSQKAAGQKEEWSCLVEAKKRYLAEVRSSYVKAIKRAKERSWKNFLECYGVDERGPANPWGTLHRQAAGKTKKKVFFGNLERDDGSWTTSWKESAELLLERFFSVMKRMLVMGPINILGNW